MTLRIDKGNIGGFDPDMAFGVYTIYSAWLETLFSDDWTLNPSVFNYQLSFRPNQYMVGNLAASYEFSDPMTFVVHLRQGIHWQNIAPANGREFVADDVVFHFDRMLGTGHGYTKPPPGVNVAIWANLVSLTATDKYTLVFKWNTANPEIIMETLQASGGGEHFETHDAVKLYGDVNDWHHSIGTGPFILTDFVSGSSATLVKNPDYWAYDQRYPQNKLPYVDNLKLLIIQDKATALAALRTGKADVMESLMIADAQSIQKTNPEMQEIIYPQLTGCTIDPRVDKKPFTDIKVRIAMQKAIDLPTIAKTYYQGTVRPYPISLTSYYLKGLGLPYEEWPQSLKDEYSYDPAAAKKLLADAGYPNGFKTDCVVDTAADQDLLQIVKSYWTAIGIDMEVRTMDTASFATYVITNRAHDQIADRGGALAITYEIMRQLTRFQTGYSVNFGMISDPVFDAYYPKAVATTSLDGIKQILKDANLYVAQQHYTISLLQPMSFGFYQPWLHGYNAQFFGVSGPAIGALLLGYYPPRFWIDQNMKKTMGR